MKFNSIEPRRSEILEWRESERKDLFDKLKLGLPDLDALIIKQIDSMGFKDAFLRSEFHDREVAPEVENWLRQQFDELHRNIKDSAIKSEKIITGKSNDNSLKDIEFASMGLSVVGTLAPIAAIPAAVSIATVTTTSFFVFTTSAVSIPILLTALAGLLVSGVTANEIRRSTFKHFQKKYCEQTISEARTRVFKPLEAKDTSCLWTVLSNEIDIITLKRLEPLQ